MLSGTVQFIILKCTHITIAFTCRSEKLQKLKLLKRDRSIQVSPVTNRVAMVPVPRRRRWRAMKSVAFISVDQSLALAVSPADSFTIDLPVHGSWIEMLSYSDRIMKNNV